MTVRVARVEARTFAGDSVSAADPALRGFMLDLVAPYGLPLREEVFAAAAGHSYGEMAEELVETVLTSGVDLLIVAYATPDVIPGRATATYLSSICPGGPLAFAVCDQGVASPFTALRIAHAYLDSGASERAAVLVLEQSALHHEPPVPARLPSGHHAVALLLGSDTGPVLTPPVVWPDLAPAEAVSLFEAELPDRGTVILGASLATLVDAAGVSLARPGVVALATPPGQPLTGAWAALARTGGEVLVADYDPALRYLCLARLVGELGES